MKDQAAFYVTGGTIPPDSPSYVERAADKELLAALGRGELCYVLNARQMGKSSLSVRTRQALEAAGTRTAFLDLQKFGSSASAEQWYRALLERIGSDLKLRAPFLTYWKENSELPPLSRLFGALRDVGLEQIAGNIVVFLDEIDVVRDLSFKTDEFFGAIRESHNARADDPALRRLTFCIIGTVAPTDLIRDIRLSPFNIGTRVRLADLKPKEAAPLAGPLPGGAKTLDRVLWWTNGHPYLTQRLCAELTNAASTDVDSINSGRIDSMVARLFFAKSDADVDENIKNVRNGLLRMGGEGTGFDRTDLLTRYGAITAGKRVADDDTDGVCTALRLSGLVAPANGLLSVRNRVYARLFDIAWVSANLPDAEVRRQRAAVARGRLQVGTVSATILVVMCALTAYALQNARVADNERTKAVASAQAESAAKREAIAERTRALADRAHALDEARKAQQATVKATAALRGEAVAQARAQKNAAEAQIARVAAQRNATDAQISAATARNETQVAQSQTRLAEANADAAARLNYDVSSSLAQRAIDENDYRLAQVYVDEMSRFVSNSHSVEAGFEYGYLKDQLHLERRQLTDGAMTVVAAYSPDGSRLAIGRWDKPVTIWDTASGKPVVKLAGLAHAVFALSFSPDGHHIQTASRDNTVRVWDARTGKELSRSPVNTDGSGQFRFFPDGKHFIALHDPTTVTVWETGTGKPVVECKGHKDFIGSIAISADGSRIASASTDKTARIWDAQSGKELLTIPMPFADVHSMAFSPDAQRIVIGFADPSDAMARVWNAITGDALTQLKGHTQSVNSVEFSCDGRHILTGSNDATTRVWDAASGTQLYQLSGDAYGVTTAIYSPDQRRIVTAGPDSVREWDAVAGRNCLTFRIPADQSAPGRPYAVFSPDGNHILTGGAGNRLCVSDSATGRSIVEIGGQDSMSHEGLLKPLIAAFAFDGKHFATSSGHEPYVHVWDSMTGRKTLTINGGQTIASSYAFSPDGNRLIVGGSDGCARIYDVYTGNNLLTLRGPSGYPIHSVAYSRDGKRIAVASWGLFGTRNARVFDAIGGRELYQLPTPMVDTFAFSPDGKRMLTGTGQGKVEIWDVLTGHKLFDLLGHGSDIVSAAFSRDGTRIATGGMDNTARIWDGVTGRGLLKLTPHPKPIANGKPEGSLCGVIYLAFSSDGKRLLTGDTEGTARIWQKMSDAQVGRAFQRQQDEERRAEQDTAIAALAELPLGSVLQAAVGLRARMPSRLPEIALAVNTAAWGVVDPAKPVPSPATASQALEIASFAVQLSQNRDGAILDTLAAAQFACGDLAKALETERTAVKLPTADKAIAAALAANLKHYEALAASAWKASNK